MEIYLVACQDFEPTSLQVPWWPGIEFEQQYLTLGEPGIRKLDLGTWVIQMIDKKKEWQPLRMQLTQLTFIFLERIVTLDTSIKT